MSAAQALVGERLAQAMGTMAFEEQKVQQVFDFINFMRSSQSLSVISNEEYNRLIPLETMIENLKKDASAFYKTIHA